MIETTALAAIDTAPMQAAAVQGAHPAGPVQMAYPTDFASLVSNGIASMDAKVAHADDMVSRFALDENIPLHQVTIALEEARLAVEFAMQVRQRFVEGYRELMNMQL